MKIEELIEVYAEQLRADGRSPHTVAQVVRHGRLAGRFFGERDVAMLDHTDVARFLNSAVAMRTPDGRSKKATSANALRSSIRTLFAFAASAGYAGTNPARLVRRARTSPPPPRALSDVARGRLVAELDRASTWAERRDRALFRTLLEAGLRVGSAVAAHVEDLDLDAGELRLRTLKGGHEDVVYLAPGLVAVLREWVGERRAGILFPNARGGRLSTRQAHRRLARHSPPLGDPNALSPHRLRHAFAMRVYARTGDLLVTARALCHRSTAATAVYARADAARVRAAVGA